MPHSATIGTVAVVGPCPPRPGALADYTQSFGTALQHRHPSTRVFVAAVTDRANRQPAFVWTEARQSVPADYLSMARYLNRDELGVDAVSLQHDFRTFGGRDGDYILGFLRELAVPVVTTLHEVPRHPGPHLRCTLAELLAWSDRVVVGDAACRDRLLAAHDEAAGRIDIIPGATIGDGPVSRNVPAAGLDRLGREDWPRVAEACNRSLLKAIINPLPGKRDRRQPAWPWGHARPFALRAGWTPGWDH